MLDLPFKVVIPSHHRAKEILLNPLYSVSHIVVNDGHHVDEYRSVAKEAGIVPGPFHVCGDLPSIAAVRNFILSELWDTRSEPFLFQMDDDLRSMLPLMHWRTERIVDPKDITAIFWESYVSSNDAGAGMFGYAHKPSFQHRTAHNLIILRGWLRAGFGISDPSLAFDDQMYVMEDVDICLASQTKSRIIWQDMRWAPVLGSNWAKAGIAHTRTEARRLECYDRINAKYGVGTVKPSKNKTFRLHV